MGAREGDSADGSAAASAWTDAPRAASCALVYSDVRHVSNVNQILEDIEEVLSEHGLAAQRLGDEIRSGQGYPGSLRKLLSDSVLGVVVLDGLRPNVTYELGFLLGLSKPVIVLQSVSAFVSAKTLYDDHAGLQKKQFDSAFKNPVLRQDHFSDFDRAHVGFFDITARRGEPRHLKTLLDGELDKRRSEIVAETTRSQTVGSPQAAVDELSEPVAALARLYYAKPADFDTSAIEKAWDAARTWADQHGIQVPPATTLMAAATWKSKARTLSARPDDRKTALNAALELYEQALSNLSLDTDPERWASAQYGIGYTNIELSLWDERARRSRQAIAAFKQVLEVHTIDRSPVEFGAAQNGLGNAFRSLALVEDKVENGKRAIAAHQQALRVRTIDRFPGDFAVTQNNLGNAYYTLAEVEDKAENCRRAIAAFEQALKVRTLDRFPREFAMTQNNLGNAFRTLAEVEDKAQNCKKAIAACEQALKVMTLDRFPIQYATTRNNLGDTFRKLAEVEDRARNRDRAIVALEESARIFGQENCPALLAVAMENLEQARVLCRGDKSRSRETQTRPRHRS
jgi:tetratricopeptide (TPR) repeat protein